MQDEFSQLIGCSKQRPAVYCMLTKIEAGFAVLHLLQFDLQDQFTFVHEGHSQSLPLASLSMPPRPLLPPLPPRPPKSPLPRPKPIGTLAVRLPASSYCEGSAGGRAFKKDSAVVVLLVFCLSLLPCNASHIPNKAMNNKIQENMKMLMDSRLLVKYVYLLGEQAHHLAHDHVHDLQFRPYQKEPRDKDCNGSLYRSFVCSNG